MPVWSFKKKDLLIRLETEIRRAFVLNEHVMSIFFDLTKAYDTTWRYDIMRNLYGVGLRERLPQYLGEFLKNRSFRVKIDQVLSSRFTQETGVAA